MDEFFAIHHPSTSARRNQYSEKVTSTSSTETVAAVPSYFHNSMITSFRDHRVPVVFGSEDLFSVASAISDSAVAAAAAAPRTIRREEEEEEEEDDVAFEIKKRICSHPLYPNLLQAYIDCQKVGAPPDLTRLLDEIQRENKFPRRDQSNVVLPLGADPELDEFMETYSELLVKCKSDLSRSFDEATTFLNKMQLQLSDLCSSAATAGSAASDDQAALSSEEECSGRETDTPELHPKADDRELKNQLLRRFGSHIGSLKLEFSKKKKKGKLPRDARQTLLDWWNVHNKWPYPTEADKIALAETTGLDQRQINNWFINQRKRHWKPPENLPFAVMNDFSGRYFVDD